MPFSKMICFLSPLIFCTRRNLVCLFYVWWFYWRLGFEIVIRNNSFNKNLLLWIEMYIFYSFKATKNTKPLLKKFLQYGKVWPKCGQVKYKSLRIWSEYTVVSPSNRPCGYWFWCILWPSKSSIIYIKESCIIKIIGGRQPSLTFRKFRPWTWRQQSLNESQEWALHTKHLVWQDAILICIMSLVRRLILYGYAFAGKKTSFLQA